MSHSIERDPPSRRSPGQFAAVDSLITAILFLAFVSLALTKVMSHDIWWQIKAGEWILNHGFPAVDPFSYAFPGRQWIEPRWFFCVVAYLSHSAFGVNALLALKVAALLTVAGVLWRLEPRAPRWVVNFALACALLVMHRRFFVRPEMFTYILLAVYLLCWHRWRSSGRITWLLPLPLLQLLWSNSHSIAILGPITLSLLIASEIIADRIPGRRTPSAGMGGALVVTLLVALACFATPYGVDAVTFPLQLLSQIGTNDPLNELIDEFRSPWSAGWNMMSVGFVVVALSSFTTFLGTRLRQAVARAPLWTAFLVLSFLAYRNIALFGVIAAYVIVLNLADFAPGGETGRPWVATVCRGFCLLLALVSIPAAVTDAYYLHERIGQRFGVGLSRLHFPVGAMQFIDSHGVPTPVLNDLGDGGYVMYREGPKSVFIDGRLEVYGGAILYDAVRMLQTGEGFEQRTRELGVDTILLRHRKQPGLLSALQRSPAWVPIYYDHANVVYVRSDPSTAALRREFRIDWRKPPAPGRGGGGQAVFDAEGRAWPVRPDPVELRDLGTLFLDVGNVPEAQRSFEKALEIFPAEETSRLHLGLIYYCLERGDEADTLLSDVDPQRALSVHYHRLVAQICLNLGKAQLALEALERAADFGGGRAQDYRLIASVAVRVRDLQRALPALQELTHLEPDDVQAWNALGEVLLAIGRDAEAIEAFAASLALDDGQAPTHTKLGIAHRRAGDLARARQAFERALVLDPGDTEAQRELEKLAR